MPERQRFAIGTGGSRGIGANTVIVLANHGMSSILTYHSGRIDAFSPEVRSAFKKRGVERSGCLIDNAEFPSCQMNRRVTVQRIEVSGGMNF